jgi:hypothetical protein
LTELGELPAEFLAALCLIYRSWNVICEVFAPGAEKLFCYRPEGQNNSAE